MVLNEQDFLKAILPNGFHYVPDAVATYLEIALRTWANGSVPVSSDTPWYAALIGEAREADEFTAWINTTCVALGINPTSTNEDDARAIAGAMIGQHVALLGLEYDFVDTIYAILVHGAAYIRQHGHAPVDAVQFAEDIEWD